MSIISNKSKSVQVFWIALGKLSSFALAFVSAAILSRYLSKEDYGTYKQVMYIYSSFLLIFTAGLPDSLTYFLPKLNRAEGKSLVNQYEKLFFGLGILFSLFIYFGADWIAAILKNEALGEALRIYSPVPLLLLPTFCMESIYVREQKSFYIAFYTVFSRILVLSGIVLPVLIYRADCYTALKGLVFSSFCMMIVALILIYKPYRGVKAIHSSIGLKDVFKYSIPLLGGDLCMMLFSSSDQFYVSRYFGEIVFAEFSNGFIPFPLTPMIVGAVTSVLIPLFSVVKTQDELDKAVNSWKESIKRTSILLYPLLVFSISFSIEMVTFIYGESYRNSSVYFSISLISNFVSAYPFVPLFLALGKMKTYTLIYFLSAISIWITEGLCILLYPSPILISIVSVCNSIMTLMIFFTYIVHRLKVNPFTKEVLSILVRVLIHSITALVVVRTSIYPWLEGKPVFLILVITFVSYYLLLILTGRWFKLNYTSILNWLKFK